MPREAPDAPAPARRFDPRQHLEADPLAARMLAEEKAARATAAQHIQSRDPRARLDAAAAALHGGKADLPFPAGAESPAEPAAKPRPREL